MKLILLSDTVSIFKLHLYMSDCMLSLLSQLTSMVIWHALWEERIEHPMKPIHLLYQFFYQGSIESTLLNQIVFASVLSVFAILSNCIKKFHLLECTYEYGKQSYYKNLLFTFKTCAVDI